MRVKKIVVGCLLRFSRIRVVGVFSLSTAVRELRRCLKHVIDDLGFSGRCGGGGEEMRVRRVNII